MIDLHAHILPGLDDGARDIEESLAMARLAVDSGVRAVAATPHLFRGTADILDSKIVKEKQMELEKALKDNDISLEVYLGAEVHVSHNLIEKIRNHRNQLVLNGGSYMFVEFPSEHLYSDVRQLFFDVMTEGITPVIVHPERNAVMSKHPELLAEFIGTGVYCQVNSGSLLGVYGAVSRTAAWTFLENRCVHFLASDCHGTQTMPPNLAGAAVMVRKKFGEKTARALVEDNPQAALESRSLPFVPDPVLQEKKRSLKIRIPSFLKR
ncbi:MAG: hypothetical protein MUP70_09380 [Candidatus Aminicenantes bacterium]|nr:hypothetical protein [Candidatus Aminicenantes bacterium]